MKPKPPTWVFLLLFLFSGAAGLVYELIWTRELVFVFGGTTYAITTVLVAFMGGLGLGSYVAGRIGDRLKRPGLIYGVLEILIGLYALLVPLLLTLAEPLYRAMYAHVGDQPWLLTAVRFLSSCMVLLIPTTLMGATLPLLVRFFILQGGRVGRAVALLYGINSLGAVLGVLLTGFVLIRTLGLAATTYTAAATNIVIGLVAVVLLRRPQHSPLVAARLPETPDAATHVLPPGMRRAILFVFAVSGFAAMVYQVTWTRALVMSIGSSTYSFTSILAAFIMGLSLGSLAVAWFVDRWRRPVLAIGIVQVVIALAALVVMPVYGRLPTAIYGLVRDYGASAFGTLLAIEFLIIIAVTFVPTLLMGAMFPLVTRAIVTHDGDDAAATGRAYGINTIGTILGSFLAGFVFLEALGVQLSVAAAAALNALAGAWLIYQSREQIAAIGRRAFPSVASMVVVLILAALVGLIDRWNSVLFSSAAFIGRIDPQRAVNRYEAVYVGEGVDLTVVVRRVKNDPDTRFLTVNGKVDASTLFDDITTQLLLGHVPALVSPRVDNTCVIGLGCGMTVAALSRYPQVQHIDCIEISEEVVAAAHLFEDFCYNVVEKDPRVDIILADGRNHLLLTDRKYDLIVSEPSNPWIAGIATLFTREFFELCKSRLTDDGRLCVWIHGYAMSTDDFKMIVRTLASVFDFVSIWEMNEDDYALIVGKRPAKTPLATALQRYYQPKVWSDLYRVGLGRPELVLGRMLSSDGPLREWAGGGRIHTDDRSVLEFTTPREIYVDQTKDILAGLLAARRSPFEDVLDAGSSDTPALAAAITGVQAVALARIKRFEAEQNGRVQRNPAAAFHTLLESLTLIPTMETYYALAELAAQFEQNPQLIQRYPQVQADLKAFDAAALPVCAVPKGEPLGSLVRRTKRDMLEAERAGKWPRVIGYAAHILRIRPREADTAVRLVRALIRAGQSQAAAQTLRAELTSGNLRLDQLRAHRLFPALSADPAVKSVIDSAASVTTTRPAANQSASSQPAAP